MIDNLFTQTALIHAPRKAPQYIKTLQPPLYRASTIIFQSTAHLFDRHWTDDYDYSYGTHGTPTTYTLIDQLALLEGGKYGVLAPSGLSAIALVNSTFLSSGDEVWVPENIYGPNLEQLKNLKKRYGIEYKIYNPVDATSFQPSEKTKLLWLEAAGSVTLEFPDLKNLVKKAQHMQVITVLDNTWGAGLAFNAFDFSNEHLGVDITVHALTKYPSGGGDIIMGSVITRDQKLHHQLLSMHATQGICVSGDDTAQIIRNLPHMRLRYTQQANNAQRVLAWLKQQPYFIQVLHPADPDSPGHHYWKDICTHEQSAGLVSVIFDSTYDLAAIRRFCDALNLFKLGFSWGGSVSLAMLYDLKTMRNMPHPHLKDGFLVRFCIGLEDPDDLIQDIQNALQQIEQ